MTGPESVGSAEDSQDPSMEEILASIRRILSEDETAGAAEAPIEAEPLPGDEILDLDPGMLVAPAPHPPAPEPERTPHPPQPRQPDLPPASAGEVAQAAAAEPLQIHPEPVAVASPAPELPPTTMTSRADPPYEALHPAMSGAASQVSAGAPPPPSASELAAAHDETDAMMPSLVAPEAAAAAAGSLGGLVRRLAAERAAAVQRGGPTIEDVVREEIRPLLKQWLDTHLPALVERLVLAEIERVVNRSQR